jgi:hypothetical protein
MAKKRQGGAKARTKAPAEGGAVPKEVRFYYEWSPLMRTIHVDGVFGGVTPHGLIQMIPFFETWRLPTSMVQRLSPDGTVGPELVDKREVDRPGMVRELEVRLVFDLDKAKKFKGWLEEKIALLEALQAGQPKDTQVSRDLQ